jgi:cupin 2 domain-containing protein
MDLPQPRSLGHPPDRTGRETVELLARAAGARVEHIVSRGEASPPGFWYDQPADEWVLLLSGSATLGFEAGPVELGPGSHLRIPARCRHRVERCSADATWLAVHFPA